MSNRPVPLTPVDDDASDEELIAQLAGGQQEALGPLYSRYAPLIFNLAARSLDRSVAEDLVQDVFLTIWRKAAMFDPERGPLRPWLLQVAHYQIVNELRRQSRRPRLTPDPDGLYLASVRDEAPGLDEQAWSEYRREALREAMEALPPPQRRALSLAFFQDLTHEQVASELELPLGTAKTRIRAGIHKLRANLAPLGVGVGIAAILAFAGLRYRADLESLHRDDAALALVTSSETQSHRLVAAGGVSEQTHAVYRGQPGSDLAVVTAEHFAHAPVGRTYQLWAHTGNSWISLGTFTPDQSGAARLIVQNPALSAVPDAVEVTLEPSHGSSAPAGPVIVSWTGG